MLAVAPYVSRIVRATLLEVLDSDYVELARLKGIPETVVMRKHALLNAMVPGIQVIALQLAWLAGGVVIVETLFNYPGVGFQLVDSVRNHDVPMVQALSMIIAGGVRRGEPARRPALDPAHPPCEDGDLVMSATDTSRSDACTGRCGRSGSWSGGSSRCSSCCSRCSDRCSHPHGENEVVGRALHQARASSAPTTSARTSSPGCCTAARSSC